MNKIKTFLTVRPVRNTQAEGSEKWRGHEWEKVRRDPRKIHPVLLQHLVPWAGFTWETSWLHLGEDHAFPVLSSFVSHPCTEALWESLFHCRHHIVCWVSGRKTASLGPYVPSPLVVGRQPQLRHTKATWSGVQGAWTHRERILRRKESSLHLGWSQLLSGWNLSRVRQ